MTSHLKTCARLEFKMYTQVVKLIPIKIPSLNRFNKYNTPGV